MNSPKRQKFLGLVLLASLIQGIVDIFLVGLLARLVGLLAGAKLGIKSLEFGFGGGLLDQAGWIVVLLIASFWFASIRFGVALLEALLAADIWSDLVNKVYRNLLLQNTRFSRRNAHPFSLSVSIGSSRVSLQQSFLH